MVVITGASRGIGAGVARLMALEKARLVITGRDQQRLAEVGESLALQAERAVCVTADITTRAGMHSVVQTAIDRFGTIDVFVNNAGVGVHKPIGETTEAEYDAIFATNVRAVYYCFQEVLPLMQSRGGGHIINISSLAARTGVPGMAAYAASKAALNVLSESVAGEVRNDGIKISVLSPASTDTNFGSNLTPGLTTASRAAHKLTVDEVAEAVVHLAKQDPYAWTSMADIRPLSIKNKNG